MNRVEKLVSALAKQRAVTSEENQAIQAGTKELKNTSRVARVMITNASSITEVLRTGTDREDALYDFDGKSNDTPFAFDRIFVGTAEGANLNLGSAKYKSDATAIHGAVRNAQLIIRQAGIVKYRENIAVLTSSSPSDAPAGSCAYELPKAVALNTTEEVDIQLKFPTGVSVAPTVTGELVGFEVVMIGGEIIR